MARIEPIPYDELPSESRSLIDRGMASGMYTNPIPLQIVAYSSAALKAMDAQYRELFRSGVLEPRLVELVRLHSADINSCTPCSQSRKEASVTEDDVACLVDLDRGQFTEREYRALRYFELLAADHDAIDDETFRWLAEVFTVAEIVELGFVCSQNLGGHRFMHTLGVLAQSEPVLRYRPDAIDAGCGVPSGAPDGQ